MKSPMLMILLESYECSAQTSPLSILVSEAVLWPSTARIFIRFTSSILFFRLYRCIRTHCVCLRIACNKTIAGLRQQDLSPRGSIWAGRADRVLQSSPLAQQTRNSACRCLRAVKPQLRPSRTTCHGDLRRAQLRWHRARRTAAPNPKEMLLHHPQPRALLCIGAKARQRSKRQM